MEMFWNLFLLRNLKHIFEVIQGFHTVRIVIHVACTGPVIGASLYAFVEFGQKRTVPINRVFSILHLLSD